MSSPEIPADPTKPSFLSRITVAVKESTSAIYALIGIIAAVTALRAAMQDFRSEQTLASAPLPPRETPEQPHQDTRVDDLEANESASIADVPDTNDSISSNPIPTSTGGEIRTNGTEVVTEVASSEPPSDYQEIDYVVLHNGGSYWAKENYYLDVQDKFKIYPKNIQTDQCTVRVLSYDNVMDRTKTLTVASGNSGVSQSAGMRVRIDGSEYIITLLETGRPGKNPFKRAAFFKVELIE